MTDRYNAFIVVLDHDYRDDDAEGILNAIRHIKGVLKVTPNVRSIEAKVAETRAKSKLTEKLYAVLRD